MNTPGPERAPVPGLPVPSEEPRPPARRAPAPVAFDQDQPCPDCQAPAGHLCHWWCPRYTEPIYHDGEHHAHT